MSDRLTEIFDHQRDLMEKFGKIERKNLPNHTEFSIPFQAEDWDSIEGQLRLKEYAWRITEELVEASDSRFQSDSFLEEMADVLHFIVELLITMGVQPHELIPPIDPHSSQEDAWSRCCEVHSPDWVTWWTPVRVLGRTMNSLRNRPWKTRFVPASRTTIAAGVRDVFWCFLVLCRLEGITPEALYKAYMKKNEINLLRASEQ